MKRKYVETRFKSIAISYKV